MRKLVATVIAVVGSYGIGAAAQGNRLVLPLPAQGKSVSVRVGQGIDFVVMPDQGDWSVQAIEANHNLISANPQQISIGETAQSQAGRGVPAESWYVDESGSVPEGPILA